MSLTNTADPPTIGLGRAVYQKVFEQVVAELKVGAAPWVQPWTTTDRSRPYNLVTKRRYQAFNSLLLLMAAEASGFEKPGWLTPKQVADLGGKLKRGAHPTVALKWFRAYTKVPTERAPTAERTARDSRAPDARSARPGETQGRSEPFDKELGFEIRYSKLPAMTAFALYNVEQVTGLAERFYKRVNRAPTGHENVTRFVAASGARVIAGGDEAYYSPSEDHICMPYAGQFSRETHYHATLLHELVHWTGHPTRLKRRIGGRFGSKSYAEEELTAELGAAFLCADLNVTGQLRHAGYIESWLEALTDDSAILFHAAARAEQAAQYLEDLAEGRPRPPVAKGIRGRTRKRSEATKRL